MAADDSWLYWWDTRDDKIHQGRVGADHLLHSTAIVQSDPGTYQLMGGYAGTLSSGRRTLLPRGPHSPCRGGRWKAGR